MHSRKSLFVFLLIGCLFFPVRSFAVELFYYTINGDTVTIDGYTGAGGTVFIPPSIGGMPVVTIGMEAFAGNTSITGVSIPDTVAAIEEMAFEGCTGLTRVEIPKSVAGIGDAAFSNCTGLTAAYFYGNAPSMGASVFDGSAAAFTVYYKLWAKGFTRPTWLGYPSKIACAATSVLGAGSPKLAKLRYFRDTVLAQSAVGRKIISMYYDNTESITAALEKSPALRSVTRSALDVIADMAGDR